MCYKKFERKFQKRSFDVVGLALRNAWFLVLVSVERFEEGRNSKRGEKNVARFYELNAVFQFLEREGKGEGRHHFRGVKRVAYF